MHPDDTDDWEYLRGHDDGYEEANDFIERHPDGMPWSALSENDPEPDPEASDYDRGYGDGWQERMKKEG
jgi:hypothetical protein